MFDHVKLGVVVVMVLALCGTARAQEQQGRIPFIELGFGAGVTGVPVPFQYSAGDPVTTFDDFGAVLGLSGRAHLDMGTFLVFGDGLLDVPLGELTWMGRVGLVVGWRTNVNLTEMRTTHISDGYEQRESTVHLQKKLPLFYGLTGSLSIFGLDESSTSRGLGATRDAALLPTVDVGLAAMTAQYELLLAPTLALTTGTLGLRWSFKYALPMGERMFFFRFNGDHFFGDDDDRRAGFMLLLTIGLTTSTGVAP